MAETKSGGTDATLEPVLPYAADGLGDPLGHRSKKRWKAVQAAGGLIAIAGIPIAAAGLVLKQSRSILPTIGLIALVAGIVIFTAGRAVLWWRED